MADTSHECCSAALCNNRSENRKDLIFHNFPLDVSLRKIWSIKMRRGDKKFASNTSLFCCSEHFTAEDYRKSLTGKSCKRHDLVKNAVPSVFPWSKNCKESSERTLRAKAREDSAVRPFVVSSETKSTSRSSAKMVSLKRKIQRTNHWRQKEIWLLRILNLGKNFVFVNLAWKGLDPMTTTFSFTLDLKVIER